MFLIKRMLVQKSGRGYINKRQRIQGNAMCNRTEVVNKPKTFERGSAHETFFSSSLLCWSCSQYGYWFGVLLDRLGR